jgi:hypothetical protein
LRSGVSVAQVCLNREAFPAVFANESLSFVRAGLVAAPGKCNLRAFAGRDLANALADASRATGYEHAQSLH